MPTGKRLTLAWLGLWAIRCSAVPAIAQTSSRPGVTEYPREYFAPNSPSNARDMIERLPGFSIVEADADVRGYAAAQGNVLIDGARPSSKREDIGQLLKRIRATSVERIELIRSGAAGFDLGGYPVLANVVRCRDATTESAPPASHRFHRWLAGGAGTMGIRQALGRAGPGPGAEAGAGTGRRQRQRHDLRVHPPMDRCWSAVDSTSARSSTMAKPMRTGADHLPADA